MSASRCEPDHIPAWRCEPGHIQQPVRSVMRESTAQERKCHGRHISAVHRSGGVAGTGRCGTPSRRLHLHQSTCAARHAADRIGALSGLLLCCGRCSAMARHHRHVGDGAGQCDWNAACYEQTAQGSARQVSGAGPSAGRSGGKPGCRLEFPVCTINWVGGASSR